MDGRAVLYLHFVLLDTDVVAAVINMYAPILGAQPHGGLQMIAVLP